MKNNFPGITLIRAKKWFSVGALIALAGILILSGSCSNKNGSKQLMGSGYGISNTTLLVNDLKTTRKYYADTLGFDMPKPDKFDTVFDAGISTSIYFSDFSSMEFLSVADTTTVEPEHAFIKLFLKEHQGVRMYSLSSSSADTTYARLTAQGFTTDSVRSYRTTAKPPKGWDWDDGGPEVRTVDFDTMSPPAHLPQFVEDLDTDYQEMKREWKTWYIYGRSYGKHRNGVVGISALKIAVEDLKTARAEFKKMGLAELDEAAENTVRFKLFRNQELHLVASQSSDDGISKFLKTRGSGVFAITFEVENIDSTEAFLKKRLPAEALLNDSLLHKLTVPQEYAFGVQLDFINEPETQATFAHQLMIGDSLDSAAIKHATLLYTKYCALCHGENREGYAADNAPSLRSQSLLATSKSSNFLRYTIHYGRANTAMAGYLRREGGPLEYIEVELILQWLYEAGGVKKPIELSRDPVKGDAALGSAIYAKNCAACHGKNGEGISAPALGNALLLATATDAFLQYAIKEGRDSTRMPAFKDSLKEVEINNVTAFLRSRASGWSKPQGDTVTVAIPKPENYVLNPKSKAPHFKLREDRYVSAKQVYQALQDSARMIILDARSKVAWRQTHVAGSVPVPYYEEPDAFVKNLPNDSTMIVVYCACPHAASGRVVSTLKRHGFKNTAIIDEGILGWSQQGYPVQHGH
jgi:cbb3-type cytochrome c oxidase subunit III